MKKNWYCVVETMEVPDDATDKEIDEILFEKLAQNREEPQDYMWSDKDNLLDEP